MAGKDGCEVAKTDGSRRENMVNVCERRLELQDHGHRGP